GRRNQVVRQRSAKPSSAGSIPAVASISVPANFNFESTVVSHGWYLLAPFRWSRKEQTLRRVEILDKKPREIAISFSGGAIRISGATDTPDLRAKITRMFQLHVDTAEFIVVARMSPD